VKAASEKTAVEVGATAQVEEVPRFWTDLMELTKARLTGLVLITTFVGYMLAARGQMSWGTLFHTLLGTAIVAVASSIFNQALERRPDRLMRRTAGRPLAAGRFSPGMSYFAGVMLTVLGTTYLWWTVSAPTAGMALLTLVIYVAFYTPLKQHSSTCTLVGAVAGALPPLVGWVAGGGKWEMMGWVLFAILFFWQLPHFLAINWLYREDYERAGFVMWSNGDESGVRTSRLALIFTFCLIAVSFLPMQELKIWGTIFLIGVGVVMALMARRFQKNPTPATARALFFYTLAYLPLALGILMVARR